MITRFGLVQKREDMTLEQFNKHWQEKGIAYDGLYGVSAGALTGVNIVAGQKGRTASVSPRAAPSPWTAFPNFAGITPTT